jgi:hypothetical protein
MDRLVQQAREHATRYVCVATLFAFVGGMNTICLLFRRHFLRRLSFTVALYAEVTSLICIFLFSYILIKALRGQYSEIDAQNPKKP